MINRHELDGKSPEVVERVRDIMEVEEVLAEHGEVRHVCDNISVVLTPLGVEKHGASRTFGDAGEIDIRLVDFIAFFGPDLPASAEGEWPVERRFVYHAAEDHEEPRASDFEGEITLKVTARGIAEIPGLPPADSEGRVRLSLREAARLLAPYALGNPSNDPYYSALYASEV